MVVYCLNVSFIVYLYIIFKNLKISKMKKGTKVHVKLFISDAIQLGIAKAYNEAGEIISKYINGVDGYYVKVDGRILAIASKYNAITPF